MPKVDDILPVEAWKLECCDSYGMAVVAGINKHCGSHSHQLRSIGMHFGIPYQIWYHRAVFIGKIFLDMHLIIPHPHTTATFSLHAAYLLQRLLCDTNVIATIYTN